MGTAMSLDRNKELFEYSKEHIYYEVTMLHNAVVVLGHFNSVQIDPAEYRVTLFHAALESFAIHLRNLISFLNPEHLRSTDIVAAQFCEAGKLPQDFPELSPILKFARRRASKEVGHLTTERIPGAPPEKDWEFAVLAAEIKKALLRFCDAALPSRLSPNVIAAVRQL